MILPWLLSPRQEYILSLTGVLGYWHLRLCRKVMARWLASCFQKRVLHLVTQHNIYFPEFSQKTTEVASISSQDVIFLAKVSIILRRSVYISERFELLFSSDGCLQISRETKFSFPLSFPPVLQLQRLIYKQLPTGFCFERNSFFFFVEENLGVLFSLFAHLGFYRISV